jgi:two-component system CheB/CheR fusion protein
LLEQAAPPSVLVNRERVILHLSESAGRFMQPRGGEFAGTVDSLLRQELRQEAQQALERAFEEQEPCQTAAVAVQFDGTSRSVSMIVHPRHTADEEACALLMFLEAGQAQPPSCAEDGETGDPVGSEQREKLRRAEKHIDNLASVHESTLQDLRVANEELQSLNEEYRSMAEELETSKEELQSVNEELQTVNAELRSKLEETSRARNDLENLMAATQIATLFLDRDLCIKRFTPPLRELFNITPRDEGRPIGDFTHLLDYPDLQEHARRVLSDLNPISHEVPAATGETLMVRLFPYRTSTDRIDGVVITFVDISQAKRSELQSLQSKQQLENELRTTQRLHRMSMTVATANDQQHALDEILAAAIDLLAADFGTIQTWDASHPLKIVASHGIRAQLLSGMERIHSAPGSATMRALESGALVHVGDVLEDEWYAPHREFAAELGYRSILSTPLFDDDGKVLGFLTTLYREPHKSTERTRQLAELLAQQASQLLVSSSQQQRLAELYSELSKRTKIIEASEAMLKRQTEILREQDMAKEDFLGLLGHELRNPLAAVRNSLEALRRTEAAGGGKSGWPAGLKIIERQSAHMTRLVNDLLDVSRINQGKLQLAPESIDIRACIEELAAAAETAAKEARLRLVLDLPTTPLRTVADPQRIVQVLDNLVRNAIQFTDAGGTVTIRARHAEGRIRIAVSDTGIGMDPAQIESLFGAYRQGAQRRRYGGLGLGLTLSRRLVQLHGGTLSAHSDGPGTGSEFVIDLPARQQAKAAAPKSSGTPPERRRVLIVDDDRDNARSMAVLLESMGQETSVALEGEGALAAAREFQPQVVLMDLSMPGMGGVEIAQRLRSEEFADQSFTLVAVSGHSQQKVPEPFDHYVMKPAALNDLLDILRSAPLESARVNP